MPTLHWLTREKDLAASAQAPYRLLEAVNKYGDDPNTENMLIHGDNLDALKALLPVYAGKVKCIYIDPPYNTKSAYEHYDDNLEHAVWLSMIYPRIELLRELLSEEGSIWVSIDDNEGHYLKVVMDEVFGRQNFIANAVWQKKYAPANDALWLSDNHDHILVFAKNKQIWRPHKLPRSEKSNSAYKNPDNDPRGPWKPGDYTCSKSAAERPNLYYPIIHPKTGKEVWPKKTRVWGYGKLEYERHLEDNRIWWGKTNNNKVPSYKRFLSDVSEDGTVPQTIWLWSDVGHTQDGRKEQLKLGVRNPFGTPKPERLLEQIIRIATLPSDIVLDSFLGSGTTAAVAHKMNRQYIGIEMGDHAETHCVPRLQKVIEGEQGGISASVNWQGGGGFRFYRLGEPVFNDEGRINPTIKFPTLAAHIWFCETKTPYTSTADTPLLGVHDGVAYYLLFNGILGDKTVDGGNVLTTPVLKSLPKHDGPKVIYGEGCRFGAARLKKEQTTFKHIPYDIKAR